jgi:hypothetical protein
MRGMHAGQRLTDLNSLTSSIRFICIRSASARPVSDDAADDASSTSRSVASRVSSWIRSKSERSIPSSSASTNSSLTSFSQLTATTSITSLKFPRAVYAHDYKLHRRGFAINARRWNPQSALYDNCTAPVTHRTFSSRSDAELVSAGRLTAELAVDYHLLRTIFRVELLEIVAEFLRVTQEPDRLRFVRVIRGLSSMSRLNHFDTWNLRQEKLDQMYTESLAKPAPHPRNKSLTLEVI